MGIYIKGMEMPECCDDCFLCFEDLDEAVVCTAGNKVIEDNFDLLNERPSFCPLVPVPPHGRLGDLDELKRHGYFFPCAIGSEYAIPLRALIDAPTIIQAEEGE